MRVFSESVFNLIKEMKHKIAKFLGQSRFNQTHNTSPKKLYIRLKYIFEKTIKKFLFYAKKISSGHFELDLNEKFTLHYKDDSF